MAEFEAAPSTDLREEGVSAHPMSLPVLDDRERQDFIAEWEAVQTRFAPDPGAAAEAARHLVGEVANRLIRRIEEIHEAAAGPRLGEDAEDAESADDETATDSGTPAHAVAENEAALQEARTTLLRCREAFFQLVAS